MSIKEYWLDVEERIRPELFGTEYRYGVWSAWPRDRQPGDPVGVGATEDHAIADLLAQLDGGPA
jgi:hypothetical protein